MAGNLDEALKGVLPRLGGIQIIENTLLPAGMIMVSPDVAEMLRRLPEPPAGRPLEIETDTEDSERKENTDGDKDNQN